MLSLKCDRCGTFYESFDNDSGDNKKDIENAYITGLSIHTQNTISVRMGLISPKLTKNIDLCPCCGNSLREWLGLEPLPLKAGD